MTSDYDNEDDNDIIWFYEFSSFKWNWLISFQVWFMKCIWCNVPKDLHNNKLLFQSKNMLCLIGFISWMQKFIVSMDNSNQI